jgi:predicted permease
MMSMVQTLIMRPLHLLALYYISPEAADEEFGLPLNDDVFEPKGSAIHANTTNNTGDGNIGEHDDSNTPEEAQRNLGLEDFVASSMEEDAESPEKEPVHDGLWPQHMTKNIMYAIFSTANVCFIAGCAWPRSWTMPVVLETVVGNMEKTVCGASLFCIGVLMWSHPFFNVGWFEVIPSLIVHHFVYPAVAMFWCWALKLDSVICRACILMFTMPVEWTGAYLVAKYGSLKNAVTYTLFWSQIVGIGCFFIWLAILNDTNVFSE